MKKLVAVTLLCVAGLAWATNAFSTSETGVALTRAAPTLANQGVNVASALGVTSSCSVTVAAESGVTLYGGPMDFWQRSPAASAWSPVPALNLTVPDAGTRYWTSEPFPMVYPAGRMLFVPRGFALGGATDGGNTLSLFYQCITDGPGAQTPRPQSSSAVVSNLLQDPSNRVYVLPVQSLCSTYAQSVVAVGDAGVAVPTAATFGRRGVTICNSTENTGSPKLKCLVASEDGGPGMGATLPGDVLAVGDCITYPVDNIVSTRCISDTAGTAATSAECIPAQ
jgi:hypothetical protein